MPGYTIGRLAQRAGVGVETIRYYHRRGLLALPQRPQGGVRRYPEDALAQLIFIRRAQEFGFTLEEIAALRQLAPADCRAGQEFIRAKHAELGERIGTLTRMRERLESYVTDCDDGRPCPFIAMLSASA